MKVSPLALTALLSLSLVDGFTAPLFAATRTRAQSPLLASNLHEFDFILQEGGEGDRLIKNALETTTRQRVILPGSPDDSRAIQMTSSFAQSDIGTEQQEQEEEMLGDDEYDYTEQLNKIQQFDDQQQSRGFNLNEFIKNADIGDIVVTLAVPTIIAFVGIRFVSGKVYNYLEDKADTTLDSFASEMMYHDGDFEEMKMCKEDYSRRLSWLGPKKRNAMLKRYLEVYAKKKTVSPQSIRWVLYGRYKKKSLLLFCKLTVTHVFIFSSLSYVFTLFNLSEEEAADVLVSLCRDMGTEKMSSAGKLLFFGSRILKSPEGKASLAPIKTLIKSTYRDEEVAESLVETSQL
jgi:hypothetical protein